VIVVASPKPGSGKTALVAHLGVAAERAGAGPAVLLDVDPDGALIDWWNGRPDHSPAFAQALAERLPESLETLRRKDYALAVIDTPSVPPGRLAPVIALAELVVVPTRGLGHELRGLVEMLSVCAETGRQAAITIMAAPPDFLIGTDAAIALSRHDALAPIVIHLSDDIALAMEEGVTAMERDPGCQAGTEVRALWRHLAGRLDRNSKRVGFSHPVASTASVFGRRVAVQ
jgi:chromosome partitioning protein